MDFLALPSSSHFNCRALSKDFRLLDSNWKHWSGLGCRRPLLAWTHWSTHLAARIQKYCCSHGGELGKEGG
eukprot:1511431-Karenia_brevis.AAC.2